MVVLQVLLNTRTPPLLFISSLLFLALNSQTVMAQVYIISDCSDTSPSSNYTSGSQFQNNLNRLLIWSLYNDGGQSRFSNATEGSYPDEVYGLLLCRGDVSVKTCQDCIDAASTRIVNECSFKKEAIIWYDECMIRYSNQSFFSTMETQPAACLRNQENETEPNRFTEILGNMFTNLTNQATSDPFRYATAVVNITGSQQLYGMVQRTPDLSALQCRICLWKLVDLQPECPGQLEIVIRRFA